MIVKETLRLHPPAPLLLRRQTTSHFKIEGYDFHPKTMVQVNVWTIGRDPTYWKHPEEFLPERFVESSIDYKGQHFEFLSFGGGRWMCPGLNMGVKIVELALANLLYHFEWKLPNGMKEEDLDMEENSGLSQPHHLQKKKKKKKKKNSCLSSLYQFYTIDEYYRIEIL